MSTLKLRDKALAMLSRRDYTAHDLFHKLYPSLSQDADVVQATIDALIAEGWLSDRRFMESLLSAKRRLYGVSRLLLLAKQHGLPDELCEEMRQLAQVEEAEVMRAVWTKKFRERPHTVQEKRKQWAYLKYRGFSDTMIMDFLQGHS